MAEPFDINRPREGMAKSALLPSPPRFDGASLSLLAQVRDVDSYVASMRAIAGSVGDSLTEAAKALGAVPPQAFSYSTMAFMPDPGNYGLMAWPGINPESLKKIARENVAPIVIARQRVLDVARYSEFSTNAWKSGWRIAMRDPREAPTAGDLKAMQEVERFMFNCSMDGGRDPRDRDAHLISPLDSFLRRSVDDMMTLDGWSIWTDTDREGRVNAFAGLPAGMIRLAVPTRGVAGDRRYFAALVDETGNPVKPFTRREMVWRVRNERNDPSVCSYGYAEIEMCVRLIQAFTGAVELNASTFTTSSIPNGMMLLSGDYFNQEQVDALMREWTNMKRGMSKLWGMPVMAVPEDCDVKIIPFMDLKGEDVRYKDHMNMMMGLCCLVWGFPIRRLGMFVSGGHRDNQPMQDAAIEIQGADDPGLPPLLSHIESTFNQYLIWPRWPRYRFEFTSKNPKEESRGFESRKLARTWKESRAEADLRPLPEMYPKDMRPLAEVMEMCPDDTVKASVFQTLAVEMLKVKLGIEDEGGEGGSPATPGPRIQNRRDAAEAQGHGHLAGTRRNSRQEKDRAALKVDA